MDRQDNGSEPVKKKRRTDSTIVDDGDELWGDDSLEFTQAELDNLAEQELSQRPQPEVNVSKYVQPSTSRQQLLLPRHESGTFLKPLLSKSSSSTSSSMNGCRRLTYSNSNQSSISDQTSSSHSSYPSSLTNSFSTSSCSITSGSSSEILQKASSLSVNVTQGLSSHSLDVTGILDKSTAGNQLYLINRYQQECAELKLEMEKLKEEVCVKAGENKLLRDSMHERDKELDILKNERIQQIYQHNIQQIEREKTLQADLTKLQIQLQFKDREEHELAERCRELETQLRNLHTGSSSSRVIPQVQSVSPKHRKMPVETRSPKGQSEFPTKKMFMSSVVSPRKQVTYKEIGNNQVATSTAACKSIGIDPRKSALHIDIRQHHNSGARLIARLFDISPTMTDYLGDRGIVGLLNIPCTSASLYSIQFDRDKDTSLLSPVKGKRLDFQNLVSQMDSPEMVHFVPIDHFNMAMLGLHVLLQSPSATPYHLGQSQGRLSSDKGDDSSSLSDGALLLLPLVNDYLKHYIEMLESKFETGTSTEKNISSPSDSFDASSNSPTSSIGMFLKTTAALANDLEALAIAALDVLYILHSRASVRNALLNCSSDKQGLKSSEVCLGMEKEVSSNESGTLSKSDTCRHALVSQKYISKLDILRKVITLSNPGTKGHLYNKRIVVFCLKILETLAIYAAGDHQMTSLLPVLSERCLQNCLECDTELDIVKHALMVFHALVKSNQVVTNLCTNTTGCVLSTLYHICYSEKWTDAKIKTRIELADLFQNSILYLASSHKGSMTILLDSSCQCSAEIVNSVVYLLYSVMKIYKKLEYDNLCLNDAHWTSPQHNSAKYPGSHQSANERQTCMKILRNGLRLLNLMSIHNGGLVNRHVAVQHQYVQLMCELVHIFKHIENNDSEMCALHELWDFNQEDSELSQDSDSSDEMDNV